MSKKNQVNGREINNSLQVVGYRPVVWDQTNPKRPGNTTVLTIGNPTKPKLFDLLVDAGIFSKAAAKKN
jgi:hypothetical protein